MGHFGSGVAMSFRAHTSQTHLCALQQKSLKSRDDCSYESP